MKEFGLKIIMTLMFLLLGFVCYLVPEPARSLLISGMPGLVFSVLTGVICGGLYGAAVGAAFPVAVCLLLKTMELHPEGVALILSYSIAALMAGMLYRIFRTAFGACLGSLLLSRLIYGVAMVVLGIVSGTSYTLAEYVDTAFVKVYPGLIILLILAPGIVHLMKKIRLMRLLGREE